MRSNFPLLIITLCSLFFASSCRSLKEPQFIKVEQVRLSKFGFNQSLFSVNLRYHNPNKTSLKLKKADGDAWIDDTYLGHFIVDTMTFIPGRSDFVLPVKLEVELGKLLKVSSLALLAGEAEVRLEGSARVGKGPIFVTYPIQYKGKQRIEDLIK